MCYSWQHTFLLKRFSGTQLETSELKEAGIIHLLCPQSSEQLLVRAALGNDSGKDD